MNIWKKFKLELAECNTKLAEIKGDYLLQVEKLENKRDACALKYEELKDSSGHAWEDIRTGTEAAWQDLKDSVEKAVAHFK